MMRAMVCVILLAACGPKAEPAKPTTEQHDHDEMANMPPAVAKFHDVLAPHWHADKGDKRMADTCAAMPDFTAGITAIATAESPKAVDTTAWTDATGKLAEAVSFMGDVCTRHDAPNFDEAFEDVHRSFHHLLGLVTGERRPNEKFLPEEPAKKG
jgi:hypothetical protein